MDNAYYNLKKEAARKAYAALSSIRSPYFKDHAVLGPGGFRHLRRSGRRARSRREQVRRFILLPFGIRVLRTATTVQEYRWGLAPLRPRRGDGAGPAAVIQWWGFVAAFVEKDLRLRVVVRKVGPGKLHFWSLMPCQNPDGTSRRRHVRRR